MYMDGGTGGIVINIEVFTRERNCI